MDLSAYVRHARKQHEQRAAKADAGADSKVTVELSSQAVRLLLAVDGARSIRALPASYPHVLDRLAGLWSVPEHAERYLEELLFTARTGRQGFPPAVVTELSVLREKNRKRLAPAQQDVWLQARLR